MNFDLSRQGPFATVFFSALLISVFWGSQLMVAPIAIPEFTPLEEWIDALAVEHRFAMQLISACVVFWIAFSLSRLVIRNVLFLERTYMPALVYLVVSSGFYSSIYSLRPLLATLALIVATTSIFRTYHRKSIASGDYVIAGFWFGVSSIVFLPSILMLPMLFVGLAIFRFRDLREWVSAFCGFLFPVAVSAGIYCMLGTNLEKTWSNIILYFTVYPNGFLGPLRHVNILEWVFIGTITILFFLSVFGFFIGRQSHNVKPYLCYIYFVVFAVIAILGSCLLPLRSIYMLPIVALPLSAIVPSFFNGRKASFVSNFLYAMFIITAVAISMLPVIARSLGHL